MKKNDELHVWIWPRCYFNLALIQLLTEQNIYSIPCSDTIFLVVFVHIAHIPRSFSFFLPSSFMHNEQLTLFYFVIYVFIFCAFLCFPLWNWTTAITRIRKLPSFSFHFNLLWHINAWNSQLLTYLTNKLHIDSHIGYE